jgi:hypothetical protein
VVLRKLASIGHSGDWAIPYDRKANGFFKDDKEIKNGGTGLRVTVQPCRGKKGRGVGIPPFLTPKP